MRNESIVITRGHIGLAASFIGGIALLLGVVGFLWQGSLNEIIVGLLLTGFGGILLWAVMTPGEFIAFVTGRQARYTTTAVFGTLLLTGIIVLIYILLQRAVITVDMTEGRLFSLSDESRQILSRITRPIRITGFYSSAALGLREVDDQFFRLYETETNGLISRQYIDPLEQPALAARFNVTQEGAVYLSYLTETGEVDFNTLARVPKSEAQERDMTQAIARLLISGTLKVYFNLSHNELNPLDGSQQGLSGVNAGIQESGLITAPLSLTELAASGGTIPADASTVILARPTIDLSTAEIAVLDEYLKRGGGLFIMADVLYNEDRFLRQDGEFNTYLWENYGIRALDAAVVETDPNVSSNTPLDVISAAVFGGTDIGERIDPEGGTPTLFSLARFVQANTEPVANTPNGQVVISSLLSYGETNLTALGETNTYRFDEGEDIPGPLSMVVWAWNEETNARILLVGDSDFATNGQVMTGGNGILFTDGLSWLSGLNDQIRFGSQAFSTGTPLIFVSTQQLDLIAFFTIILMPGLALVAGVVVWARRGRR